MFNIEVDEDILVYAVRYALGRQTYAVADCIIEVEKHKDEMSTQVKNNIKSDIMKHLMNIEPEDDTCYNDWKKLYKELNNV